MINGQGAPAHEVCAGTLAETTFLNALCACKDVSLGDTLRTFGFDSRQGAYQVGLRDDSGAAVGVNGAFQMPVGQADIGGSLAVASQTPMQLAGQLLVRGDFRAAGDVTVAGQAEISRNALLGGSFLGIGLLSVGGTLHHQGTVTALPLSVAGRTVQEAVSIAAPCACDSQELVPVQSLVQDAAQKNDNAVVGLNASALEAIRGSKELTLPCGRFSLTSITGDGDVILDVVGKTALFVSGSVDLEGGFEARLGPDAELDLFVHDDLRVAGHAVFGDPARPYATRIYVGGSAAVSLPEVFVGNLYAPTAPVVTTRPSTIWGSVFALDFVSTASVQFLFDRAIFDAASGCAATPPPQGCDRCGWCTGGTACVNNACGPCRTDEDCCSQSVCIEQSCTVWVDVR